MSIGPLLPGRLPGSLSASRLLQNIQAGQLAMNRLQDQVASGQKFFVPSESPTEAIRAIFLQKTIERKAYAQDSVRTTRSFLLASESALAEISDLLNQAKSFTIAGVGDSSSQSQRNAMAAEVDSMLQRVVNVGNTSFRGKYLFAGSRTDSPPFEDLGNYVRYNGNEQSLKAFIDINQLTTSNIDGNTAFNTLTTPITKDVDPALTLDTKINTLLGGQGIPLGPITITIDDTVNPIVNETIDISNAKTIGDIKTIIENAIGAGPPSLTVAIDPASNNGILLTPSGGTVAVSDVAGSTVARDLGIASAPAAMINGADLDPTLTLATKLADFNNGAGIGATAGNGLVITSGDVTKTVDIDAAVTVEDLFNILASQGIHLNVAINDDDNGLAIGSRRNGQAFAIGENNGTNAAGLGIRTLDGTTRLADLNRSGGVPVNEIDQSGNPLPAEITINRRDGTVTVVDLQGLSTVQEVIDAITAVDANLTASLNTVGVGISITDLSGAGSLEVESGHVADALGLTGIETGNVNTVALAGSDVNPQLTGGVFGVLVALSQALQNGDNLELSRLDDAIDKEIDRFAVVRGELGGRLKLLDDVENRLLDEDVLLQESLSTEFDADLTEVITRFAATQAALTATLQIAATSLQLNLLSFL